MLTRGKKRSGNGYVGLRVFTQNGPASVANVTIICGRALNPSALLRHVANAESVQGSHVLWYLHTL